MNSLRNVKYLHPITWANSTARLLQGTIEHVCIEHGFCSVFLTGGRSAERLYGAWAELPAFNMLRNVHFYFGDERCVPPDDPRSNYGLAMRTLFQSGVPRNCSVSRMAAEQADHAAAAADYEKKLPDRLDVVLLSVGEDGHIASIFPRSDALYETARYVVPVSAPKPPYDRITVTLPLIAQAIHVFVMAFGEGKAAVFEQVKDEIKNELKTSADLPAKIVLGATWLLNSSPPPD